MGRAPRTRYDHVMSDHSAPGPRLLDVKAGSDHELHLRFEDGTVGTIDLSHELRRGGVFAPLRDPALFRSVRLAKDGQVEWPTGPDLCPHALYLRVTGKAPREIFPGLAPQSADA
jgi:Protein of unknown function (DUF2442)